MGQYQAGRTSSPIHTRTGLAWTIVPTLRAPLVVKQGGEGAWQRIRIQCISLVFAQTAEIPQDPTDWRRQTEEEQSHTISFQVSRPTLTLHRPRRCPPLAVV